MWTSRIIQTLTPESANTHYQFSRFSFTSISCHIHRRVSALHIQSQFFCVKFQCVVLNLIYIFFFTWKITLLLILRVLARESESVETTPSFA
jgi:hypothetical protein